MSAPWNFDVASAPKGGTVPQTVVIKGKPVERQVYEAPRLIVATECGKVTTTRWLPESERWEMFSKGSQFIAWQPWPEHPSVQSEYRA